MKETILARNNLKILGALFILLCLSACEKKKYDLLDPAYAGVWTLFDVSKGLPGNSVRDITRDSQDNLWITFENKGAAIYDNGAFISYNTANSDILSNSVTSVGTGNNGAMIFGTSDGLSIRSADGQWSSYKDPLAATMYINTVKVTSNGWIWIGTQNQGFYINDGTGYYNVYTDEYKNIIVIEEDSNENVWIGTDNGLLKWDGSKWTVLSTADGLPDNDVTSLLSDSKKRLWIGTNGGETVSWIENSEIHQLSLMNGSFGTFIRDIFEDRKGDIWFATWYDGLIRFDGVIPHSFKVYNGFYENDVNCIEEDKYGNLWFGLYSKGLVKYTLPLE